MEYFPISYSTVRILHNPLEIDHPKALRVDALTFVRPIQGVETDSV
jgi:hypothetical protein